MLVAALRTSQETAPLADRLERGDDLGERYLLGWGRELKTTFRTSLGSQYAGPNEGVQSL